MGLKIGDTVGDYRIIGPLASGGMGEVFRAEHVITKRVEAIKVLFYDGAGTEEQRFLREIQLQASLSHPHIAAVHNAFRFHDDLVMVMELVEGEPLRALLDRGRLPLSTAVEYACQALEAIGYAHAHGVIHRDITPSNILVTAQGSLKLTDFGLAKARVSAWASQSGAPLGSPHYMPPEQVKGISEPDARSDIYALGAVLYEMATGRKLFESESAFSVMQAQVESAPLAPAEADAGVPAELSTAILTALEKDPRRRFPSAEAFRAALVESGDRRKVPPRRRRFHASRLRFAAAFAATFAVTFLVATRMMHSARHVAPPPPVVSEVKAAAPALPPVSPAPVPDPPAAVPAEPHAALAEPESPPPESRPAPAAPRHPKKTAQEFAPRVPGDTRPAPSRPPTVEARRMPEPARPAPPEPASAAPREPDRAASEAPPSPAAARDKAAAPAKDAKEKKPRHRVWRALGKILSPFH